MPALSKDELVSLNADKIYKLPFVLNLELWKNIDPTYSKILNAPVRLRFDEDIQSNLGTIKDKKGIYMFIVEPEFPFVPPVNYLVYVGRVTRKNTFRNRFYDYVSAIGDKRKRENIRLLTNLWPGKTWVYFYELSSQPDTKIIEIEKSLFDNIIPPLNNDFKSSRARNSRSIYS